MKKGDKSDYSLRRWRRGRVNNWTYPLFPELIRFGPILDMEIAPRECYNRAA